MNRGLSEELKQNFPDTTPINRPIIENPENINPNWLAGFMDGECCFFIYITDSKANKTGYQISLKFTLTQHNRDLYLISKIKEYLACGQIYKTATTSILQFSISKFTDILDKIIAPPPFFGNYPLQGSKSQDYADFCKIVNLIKIKAHLTKEGVDEIKKIKSGMNRGRVNSKLVSSGFNNKTLLSPLTQKRTYVKMKSFNMQLINTYALSNIFNTRKFSICTNKTNKLNPYFVTGFAEGEGCFLINVRPNPKLKTGYSIELVFKITLHSRDRALLEKIQGQAPFFGVGTVTVRSDGCVQY